MVRSSKRTSLGRHAAAPAWAWSGPAGPARRGTLGLASGTPATASRLGQVDDQALPDQRAQDAVSGAGGQRCLHDVPDQDLVVRRHRRMLVVAGPDQAAQPPVRRVQAMGVVETGGLQPGGAQAALERGPPVDADVATRVVVVLVGQGPIDGLGPAPRHGDGHGAAGTQHPGQLTHGGQVVRDVLEHLGGDDAVEGTVGEGQGQRVPLDRSGRVVGSQLARLHHGGQRPADLGHFLRSGVERHDRRPAAGRLERVPAEATAQVEKPVARTDAELVVVDRQHGMPSARLVGASGAPGRGRPSSRAA